MYVQGFVKVVRCQMVKYSRTFQKSSEWAEEGKVAANRRRTNKKGITDADDQQNYSIRILHVYTYTYCR